MTCMTFGTLGEGFIRKLCILCTKRIKIFNFTTKKLNFWSLQSQFLVDQFLTKKRVVPPPCACLFPDNLQIYIWTVFLIWTVYVWTVILERYVFFEKSCVITLTLSCLFRVPGMSIDRDAFYFLWRYLYPGIEIHLTEHHTTRCSAFALILLCKKIIIGS